MYSSGLTDVFYPSAAGGSTYVGSVDTAAAAAAVPPPPAREWQKRMLDVRAVSPTTAQGRQADDTSRTWHTSVNPVHLPAASSSVYTTTSPSVYRSPTAARIASPPHARRAEVHVSREDVRGSGGGGARTTLRYSSDARRVHGGEAQREPSLRSRDTQQDARPPSRARSSRRAQSAARQAERAESSTNAQLWKQNATSSRQKKIDTMISPVSSSEDSASNTSESDGSGTDGSNMISGSTSGSITSTSTSSEEERAPREYRSAARARAASRAAARPHSRARPPKPRDDTAVSRLDVASHRVPRTETRDARSLRAAPLAAAPMSPIVKSTLGALLACMITLLILVLVMPPFVRIEDRGASSSSEQGGEIDVRRPARVDMTRSVWVSALVGSATWAVIFAMS